MERSVWTGVLKLGVLGLLELLRGEGAGLPRFGGMGLAARRADRYAKDTQEKQPPLDVGRAS
jgi:hypothetical protein